MIRGKVTTSRETRELQIRINNWELGVFFPIYRKEQDYLPNQDYGKRDLFYEHSVPIPYIRPPPRYETNEAPKVTLQISLINTLYLYSII